MSQHSLALTLARELCTHTDPCPGCLHAAELVMVNQPAVLRFLQRIAHAGSTAHHPAAGWPTATHA